MNKKINYCNQKNTPCNQNAQLWYYYNAVNKYNNTNNTKEKIKQMMIINYYFGGKNAKNT